MDLDGEVRGDDDGCAFVEPADEVEQELSAGAAGRAPTRLPMIFPRGTGGVMLAILVIE